MGPHALSSCALPRAPLSKRGHGRATHPTCAAGQPQRPEALHGRVGDGAPQARGPRVLEKCLQLRTSKRGPQIPEGVCKFPLQFLNVFSCPGSEPVLPEHVRGTSPPLENVPRTIRTTSKAPLSPTSKAFYLQCMLQA